MSMMVIAQILMGIVLLLMISGKTPLYLTAILGSAVVAVVAGFPLSGNEPVTLTKLVNSGLISVVADMTGVLLFLGVLEGSGFLAVIVRAVIRWGVRIGGGPGILAAAGIAAGIIGMLTGYSPPIVTGAIACPAAVKMGVDPNRTAGSVGHAGILGNFGGFTHPTQVALIGVAGIGFGLINVAGIIAALTVIGVAFIRNYLYMKKAGTLMTPAEAEKMLADTEENDKQISTFKACLPFLVLVLGFITGTPVFIVGMACGLLVILLARMTPSLGEQEMLKGLRRMAIPLVATIGFVFMSSVIKAIGLTDIVSAALEPFLNISPILVMLFVSVLAGTVTQSYSASGALTIPLITVVINAGANPLAACIAACGGAAIMQHFLTGGPVANLPTLIPVTPGSDLKKANLFQRPNQLCGVAMVAIMALLVNALM